MSLRFSGAEGLDARLRGCLCQRYPRHGGGDGRAPGLRRRARQARRASCARSKTAHKLLTARPGRDLDATGRELTRGLWEAPDAKARLWLLRLPPEKGGWDFFLPTASAVLTVLWPNELTVYDQRVCEQLVNPGLGDTKVLSDVVDPTRLGSRYQEFVKAVHAAVPGTLPLRDKDRILWARSAAEQLDRDIEARFSGPLEKEERGV